jgi:nucleotide-binding universal stress UspA family protein
MGNDMPREYQAIAAIDFSDLGNRTLEEALNVCRTHKNALLHVIIVGSAEEDQVRLPGEGDRVLPAEEATEAGRKHVAGLVEEYQQRNGELTMERIAVYVATGHPAERIVALADAVDADLIVMGTHGRTGLKRWVLGSVAEEVVRRAPCGVFVIRPRDFLAGEKVPDLDPPLRPGEHSLKPFHHRPTFHYISRVGRASQRMMPAS